MIIAAASPFIDPDEQEELLLARGSVRSHNAFDDAVEAWIKEDARTATAPSLVDALDSPSPPNAVNGRLGIVHKELPRRLRKIQHEMQRESLASALKATMAVKNYEMISPTQFFVGSGRAGAWFLYLGGMETNRFGHFVFILGFATCCYVCTRNLYQRDIPYHNLPLEILTAYIHVPITHAWLQWSQLVRSRHAAQMMGVLGDLPEDRLSLIVVSVRWGSLAALVLMVGTSLLVLGAYAVPAILASMDSSSNGDEADVVDDNNFQFLHGVLMIPSIPLVVCALLVCYALVVFFSAAHYFDFHKFSRRARSHIALTPDHWH